MTDRRSGPPLFDLMRERGNKPDAPAPMPEQHPQAPPRPAPTPAESAVAPAASPDSPPSSAAPAASPAPASTTATPETAARKTAWDTSGGVSRAERSAAAMLDEEIPTDSGIQLTTTRFYTMIAVALVLIIGAWAGGYQLGKSDGKKEMTPFVSEPLVVEPPQGASDNTPPTNPRDAVPQDTQSNLVIPAQATPQANQAPQQPTPPTPQAIMTASGFVNADPRQPGMNYLVLATLSAEQAHDAVKFMGANGVQVMGAPQLDSGRDSANNPSRYTLYSLGLAIPGNRWSSMSLQRTEHQRSVARLGARWQREHRGGSDFSQTNWEKFEP